MSSHLQTVAAANESQQADVHLCPTCRRRKHSRDDVCVHEDCMSHDEYAAFLDAHTDNETRWAA